MLFRAAKTVVCCTLGPIIWGLLSLLFLLIVALGITALVLYFVYKPQLPECDVQSVTVTRLNVTRLTSYPFNETAYAALAALNSNGAANNGDINSTGLLEAATASGALGNSSIMPRLGLNADVGFTLEARNPNKVALDYKYVNASIIYRGVTVGNTSIPPFTQDAQTNVSIPATLLVIDFPLDIVTGPVMLADFNVGSVPLQLLLQLGARINILGVASPFALDMASLRLSDSKADSQQLLLQLGARINILGAASPFALVGLLCDITADPITRTVKDTHCSLQDVGFA